MTSAGNGEYYANILCNGGIACKILDLGGPVIVEVQSGNARTLTFIIVSVDCLFTNGVIFDLYAVNPDFVQRNLQTLEGIGGKVFGFAVRCDHNCQELNRIGTAAGNG